MPKHSRKSWLRENVNILVNMYSHPYKTLDQLGEFCKSKHFVFGHKHILKMLSIL